MVNENVNSTTRPSGSESVFEGSTNSTPIDVESSNETQSNNPTILPRTSRHISKVWDHYTRKQIGDKKTGVIKAECNYCERQLAGGPNARTTHLKEHLKSCLKRLCKDLWQTRLFGAQSDPANLSDTITLAPYEFCQDDGRRELAEMIILHEYPLSMVKHYGFRKYTKTLQRGFKVPCRNTTRKVIMIRYASEKENMIQLLEKTKSKVSLTTDMWTSSNQRKVIWQLRHTSLIIHVSYKVVF